MTFLWTIISALSACAGAMFTAGYLFAQLEQKDERRWAQRDRTARERHEHGLSDEEYLESCLRQSDGFVDESGSDRR